MQLTVAHCSGALWCHAVSCDPVSESDTPQKSSLKLVNLTPNRTNLIKFALSVCGYIVLPKQQSSRVSWWLRRPPFNWRMLCSGPRVGKHLSGCCVSLSNPRPLKGGLFSLPPGEDFHHGLANFVEMSIYSGMQIMCSSAAFRYTLYVRKINFWLHFFFKLQISFPPTALHIQSSHTGPAWPLRRGKGGWNSLVYNIWWPTQSEFRVTFLSSLHETENWTPPPWLLHPDWEFPKG